MFFGQVRALQHAHQPPPIHYQPPPDKIKKPHRQTSHHHSIRPPTTTTTPLQMIEKFSDVLAPGGGADQALKNAVQAKDWGRINSVIDENGGLHAYSSGAKTPPIHMGAACDFLPLVSEEPPLGALRGAGEAMFASHSMQRLVPTHALAPLPAGRALPLAGHQCERHRCRAGDAAPRGLASRQQRLRGAAGPERR